MDGRPVCLKQAAGTREDSNVSCLVDSDKKNSAALVNLVTFQTFLKDNEGIRCAAGHIIQVNRKWIIII